MCKCKKCGLKYRAGSDAGTAYSVPETTTTQASEQPQVHNTIHENSFLQEFDKYENEESSSTNQKTQLDLYLLEPRMRINDKLDVLFFWKSNQLRYPELSSGGGRVLDQYRSALLPENVEALICSNDWLFKKKDKLEPTYEELTEDILEEFRKEEQSTPNLNVLES
ncbi:Bed zinc finger [Thalictrum thalictroides]|uniref:Bed zinc finger n=2 Tax=Thalictrum thalictroides TaxID=46969 RepID=A0A7J6XC98_THATH|nr:Bed zinc finger [Thalictrum thalictroides]